MSPENDELFPQLPANEPEKTNESPSLLPGLLQRLGLDEGQQVTRQVPQLLADLKHPAWYVRAAAVRALGERAPLEALFAALDDPHVSVRANAVLALSALGEQAPIERIAEKLLHDDEWQVRESAALALGKLGFHAPETPLLAALSDSDELVRHAARQALEDTHPDLLNLKAQARQEGPQVVQHVPLADVLAKSWDRMRLLFEPGQSTNSTHPYEREENMLDNNFSTETTSYTSGKNSLPDLSRQPRRPIRRIAGLSLAAAVVIAYLLTWTLLTHTLRPGSTQTGSAATTSITATATLPEPATPNASLGKTLYVYPPKATGLTDGGSFASVGWSADGKYVSVSDMVDITLLDASNGHVIRTFGQNASSSYWTSWSPSGEHLVASGQVAQIWDVQTGQVLATFTPQSAQASTTVHQGNPMARLSGGDMIYASAFSPDNKLVASAVDGVTYGYDVQIWNAATGAYMRTLQVVPNATASDYIDQIAWSPDGKYLAASSPSNGVYVWNTTTWQLAYTKRGVSGVTWSPQGDLIASVSHSQVQVWQATTGKVQFSFQGQAGTNSVSALAWSPNGQYIAASGQNVRIWSVANQKLVYVYNAFVTAFGKKAQFDINSLAWAPDSSRLASMATGMDVLTSTGGGDSGAGYPLNSVRVWIAA
jgi:WD40 repeat protein